MQWREELLTQGKKARTESLVSFAALWAAVVMKGKQLTPSEDEHVRGVVNRAMAENTPLIPTLRVAVAKWTQSGRKPVETGGWGHRHTLPISHRNPWKNAPNSTE